MGSSDCSTKRCTQSKSLQDYCCEQHPPCRIPEASMGNVHSTSRQDPPSGDWTFGSAPEKLYWRIFRCIGTTHSSSFCRSLLVFCLQSCQGLQLVYSLVVFTRRLVVMSRLEMKLKGNGLYLAPHSPFVEGDGLFLKHGNDISDGAGLLMGKNSS